MNKNYRRMGLLLTSLPMAALACNLGATSEGEPAPPPPQEQTQAEIEPEVESSIGPVTSREGVRSAVVQIQAEGTFVDPEFGTQVRATGEGSGFIIDPSGIAVTNNHVVTGAALLEVWLGGESRPRNARILGVSECSDLAVIDIEGENFPYLEWYDGSIDVGLEVYAAGFPLGDPEFTLTDGIISKANADGETSWASLGSVLEHTATINPGNSGGPLVDGAGKVIGINYASNPRFSQYFSIHRDDALSIIDTLKQGRDVDSMGVNGEAFGVQDLSMSGIWVYSVSTGSAADRAGIQPGDIITELEHIPLAGDGSMKEYCSILKSQRDEKALAIDVLRPATGELLEGQLNGSPLEVAFSFHSELGAAVEGDSDLTTYSNYEWVTDEFGSITVEIPAEWNDVDGSPWVDDGEVIGAGISAASNLDDFFTYWDEPGIFFGASDDLAQLGGYVQLLDIVRPDFMQGCELDGRYDYEDVLYRGKYDLFTDCGGSGGSLFMVLTAVPNDDPTGFLILLEVQIVNDADLEAVDRILDSFEVVAGLP